MRLAEINSNEIEQLRKMRNKFETRKWCRQVGLINDLDQKKWFESIQGNQTIKMFNIIEGIKAWNHDDAPLLTDKIIGVCGLTSIDYIARRAEFSCYIDTPYRRKGYCGEALYRLFRFGFDELNLNLIWGETFENNPAQHLFEKVGMVKEGIRREFYYKQGKYIDAILYSIKKEELIDIKGREILDTMP